MLADSLFRLHASRKIQRPGTGYEARANLTSGSSSTGELGDNLTVLLLEASLISAWHLYRHFYTDRLQIESQIFQS